MTAVLSPTGSTRPGLNSNLSENWSQWDADQVFEKFSVAEARRIQIKLKKDVDDKQEELRLMVGERYRDLLQASTAILSMNQSTKEVISNLDKVQEVCENLSTSETHLRTPVARKDDQELQSLQALAAHVKLLLDVPEHLWRLMERKQFLQTAWLYLVARVVYRSLSSDEPQENEGWGSQDMPLLSQLPVIQRQWDIISQFRAQIIHRATQALRDHISESSVFAQHLLTLRIMDHVSLQEAFNLFIDQRSKLLASTLASMAATSSESRLGLVTQTNEETAPEADVESRVQAVRDVVLNTILIALHIFVGDGEANKHGALADALQEMAGEAGVSDETLIPSTEALLASLPSSTHLLTLPPSIRFYRPVMEDSSSAAFLQPEQVISQLTTWLTQSLESVQFPLSNVSTDFSSVKQVWQLRTTAILPKNADDAPLVQSVHLMWNELVTSIVHKRTVELWRTALQKVQSDFESALNAALETIGSQSTIKTLDEFRFAPLPTVSPSTTGGLEVLQQSLSQRLQMRTPELSSTLDSLALGTRKLQHDLLCIDRPAAGDILPVYQGDAAQAVRRVIDTLELHLNSLSLTDPQLTTPVIESRLRSAVFLGTVASNIASSPASLHNLACTESDETEAVSSLRGLHRKSLELWKQGLMIKEQESFKSALRSKHSAGSQTKALQSPCYPSSATLESCRAVSSSLRIYGLDTADTRCVTIVQDVLLSLVSRAIESCGSESAVWSGAVPQQLYDLLFLRRLVASCTLSPAMQREDLQAQLDASIKTLRQQFQPDHSQELEYFDKRAEDTLDRCLQSYLVLLSPLIDRKSVKWSKSRAPTSTTVLTMKDAKPIMEPALHFVKPSNRIGLLHISALGL